MQALEEFWESFPQFHLSIIKNSFCMFSGEEINIDELSRSWCSWGLMAWACAAQCTGRKSIWSLPRTPSRRQWLYMIMWYVLFPVLCLTNSDNVTEYLVLDPNYVIMSLWCFDRGVNWVQHFWEVLEGGEGRTQWALDKMGLGPFSQEQAVVLSMGQVSGGTISQFNLLSKRKVKYLF
jgi:hypothetical protein